MVFSNIYVALPVSALAWSTFILFNTEVNFQILFFIYCSTFTIYNVHRVVGLRKIKKEQLSPRHVWAIEHIGVHYGGIVAGILGLIYFGTNMGLEFILVLGPAGAIAFGYSVPIIKRKGKIWRLRDLPFAKVFLISLTVSYVTTYLPLYDSFLHDPGNLLLLGFFVARACFLLAITIPFDVRDYDFDAPSSLNTLPLLFGIDKAKMISLYALAFSAALSFFLFHDIVFFAIPLMISAMISAWIVSYAQKDSSEYYYSLFVEGTMLIQFVLVWGFSAL